MVGLSNVAPTIAVKDLEKATGFYGGVLGLKLVHESPYELTYQSGDCHLILYVSNYAGTNQATYASWEVKDIESEIAELKDHDVTFEHYDLPGSRLEGDIHTYEENGEKAVWFKDPDGNILNLVQPA